MLSPYTRAQLSLVTRCRSLFVVFHWEISESFNIRVQDSVESVGKVGVGRLGAAPGVIEEDLQMIDLKVV